MEISEGDVHDTHEFLRGGSSVQVLVNLHEALVSTLRSNRAEEASTGAQLVHELQGKSII